MKRKVIVSLILSMIMTASVLVGCGDKDTETLKDTEQVQATEAVEAEEPETETESEITEPETVTETEFPEEAAFTVTELSAIKYAKQSVNVRKGPSADYEKLGGLSINQKVTVTGQADTGWYRIEYNGVEGYVSDKYLTDEKTASASTSGSNSTSGNNGNVGINNSTTSGSSTVSGNINISGSSTVSGNNGGSESTSGTVNAGNTENNGDASVMNAPSADTGNANTSGMDTSGSNGTGNSGDTTPPAGAVIDPNTGMTIPDDVVIEDWSGMQGGADDGTDLGGTSTWY